MPAEDVTDGGREAIELKQSFRGNHNYFTSYLVRQAHVSSSEAEFSYPRNRFFYFYSPFSCYFQSLVYFYVTDRDWRLQQSKCTGVSYSSIVYSTLILNFIKFEKHLKTYANLYPDK
jgi:hypothetical protein